MNGMICVINKDIKEYLRGRKNVYFSLVLLAIGAIVTLTTLFFPALISALARKAPDMISSSKPIDEIMRNLFPGDLKGSYGIWASDVGVFYGIVAVFMTHGLVTNEIANGKWLMPVASGYSKSQLLFSKCLIYGAGAAFPVFIMSNVYYYVGAAYLDVNLNYPDAIIASVVLSLAMAVIVIITILSSVFYKHSITAGASMIMIVLVAPDALTFFTVGKYMPTYILTYVYKMENHITALIIPAAELILIVLVLFAFAVRRVNNIEISR